MDYESILEECFDYKPDCRAPLMDLNLSISSPTSEAKTIEYSMMRPHTHRPNQVKSAIEAVLDYYKDVLDLSATKIGIENDEFKSIANVRLVTKTDDDVERVYKALQVAYKAANVHGKLLQDAL